MDLGHDQQEEMKSTEGFLKKSICTGDLHLGYTQEEDLREGGGKGNQGPWLLTVV